MNLTDRLGDLLTKRYGLQVEERSRDALSTAFEEMRREKRMSPEALMNALHRQELLVRSLASRITVGESFFYRHPEHLGVLVDAVRNRLEALPPLRPLVIWSAGCADGQEAYSVAMACRESLNPVQLSRITIIASDLSSLAVERAEKGEYLEWSFRGFSPLIRDRYFTPVGQGRFQLMEEIRKMVRFECVSLQEHAMRLGDDSVDFLFFRNVAIYFEAAALDTLFERFRHLLDGEGLLFMAPSDQTPPRAGFRRIGESSTSVYFPVPEGEISTFIPPEYLPSPGKLRFTPMVMRVAESAPTPPAKGATNDRSGDLEGYVMRGQRNLANDLVESAADDFRRAVFLSPNDPLARFWYALSLHRSGVPRRSLFQIHHLFVVLHEMPENQVLSDGNTTVADLLSATEQLKERIV